MKSRYQGIIDAKTDAGKFAELFIKSSEELIEREKPEGHYALFNLEAYRKKFFNKEIEKTKPADFTKYSPN